MSVQIKFSINFSWNYLTLLWYDERGVCLCVCATENWIAGDAPLNTLTKLQDSHGEIPVFGLFGSACTSDCHSVRIISFPEKFVSLISIWKLPCPKIHRELSSSDSQAVKENFFEKNES